MASGYNIANGQDLDTVFAPQHPGWPQVSATEFFDNGGNDLNLRYAPISTGLSAAPSDFVLSSGSDLSTVFAAYGTTNVQVLAQPANVAGVAAAGNPSGTVTSNTTTCAAHYGYSPDYTYTWHMIGSGASFTNPNSPTTAVTGTVNAGTTNFGSMYCTMSDGVTSVNTATKSWSLQNTSPSNPLFTITAQELKNSLGAGSNYYGFATNHQAYYGGTLNSVSGFVLPTTVYEIFDNTQTVLAIFGISGLSADPGQGSLQSVTANNVTLTGSTATSYLYSSGYAQWQWTGSTFNFVAGNSYGGYVIRNGAHGW